MKRAAARFLLLTLAPGAAAQANHDDLTPLEIAYTTTIEPDLESYRIDIDVEHVSRPRLHFAMPNWTPGAYGIGRYGENVEDLLAMGSDGALLPTTRLDHQTWSVETGGRNRVHVSYSISAAERRFGRAPTEGTPTTGLHLSGPRAYLYVKGAKHLPVSVRYHVPAGWGIANGLLTGDDPSLRRARDYDTFIDAPTIFGVFQERRFEVGGTPFECVFFENDQTYDFDLDSFVAIVHRIVEHQGELFGSFPFPNYVFLFTIPGGGGLEHLNSTSIGLSASRQKDDPRAGASVTAHEFFHAWNVKRIRPRVLGPFEYEHESYTGNLWVSEGWTSYFGDLTLVRTGIWSRDEYLSHLAAVISREQSKPRRKEHSVYWASRNVWHRRADEGGPRVDYYGKGELLGALIDLRIRHETDDRKSLNDVMRFLNRWFAERGVGFEENDVERACTAISNYDFSEFFARHVHGTVDPPFAEHFAFAGIEYEADVIECSFPFPLRGRRVAGRPSAGAPAGAPRPGDVLVLADGAEFENAREFLRARAPGDSVRVLVERGEEMLEFTVELSAEASTAATLRFATDPTAKQLRIRESWLSSAR